MKVLGEQDDDNKPEGVTRRHALECMIWAGTGVLWTVSGGVPKSLGLLGAAEAAEAPDRLHLPADLGQPCRLRQGRPIRMPSTRSRRRSARSRRCRQGPSFMIHTGDITHLSKAGGVRQRRPGHRRRRPRRPLRAGRARLHRRGPGKAYLDRYGKGTKGAGWYSFDQHGVHFIGLVNVVDLKAGGLGNLGAEQLAWLADDLKG